MGNMMFKNFVFFKIKHLIYCLRLKPKPIQRHMLPVLYCYFQQGHFYT